MLASSRSRLRRLLVPLLAIAGFATLCVLLKRPSDPGPTLDAPVVTPAAPASAGLELEAVGAPSALPTAAGDPVAPPVDRVPAVGAPTVLALSGPLRVTDRDGEHRPSSRGWVEWIVHAADGTTTRSKTGIEEDRWSIEASSDAVLEPVAVLWKDEADAQHAVPAAVRIPARDADGRTVEAVFEYGFALNVVDSETRAHVPDAHVVLAGATGSWSGDTRSPPEEFERGGITVDGDSPLSLPHRPGTRVGWVRAPGYAWRRFAFSGKDGELTVPLHRGVDVDVVVHGLPPDHPNPRLVVRALPIGDAPAEREPIVEVGLAPRGSVTLLGLPAGPTEFAVVGAFTNTSAPDRLGQVRETLRPGPRALVVLDLDGPEAVALYGSIEVAVRGVATLGSRMACIEVHGDDGRPPRAHFLFGSTYDEDGTTRWTCERLLEGEYVVVVQPGAVSQAVTVQPGEVASVVLDTERTVPLTVRLFDPETGRFLRAENYTVGYRPSTAWKGSWQETSGGREDVFAFRVAPGPLTVGAWPGGGPLGGSWHAGKAGPASREAAVRDVVVPPEGLALEIALPRFRFASFRLRALQGEGEVPLPMAFWTTLRVTPVPPTEGRVEEVEFGAQQVAALGALDCTHVTVRTTRPGRYRVELDPALGIAAPQAFEVDAFEDEVIERSFQVVFD